MQFEVEETRKLRRASASIRDGGIIHVKVPHHWSRDLKRSVVEELVGRLEKKDEREKSLLKKQATQQMPITLSNQAELEAYVQQINEDTFKAPLGKVQIGTARYNHLAQLNLHSKTMTVSKYCLHNAPADALRYLIVHELAHYFESGHGPQFWALVAQHVPDYRLQSRIIKAFHHQAVIEEEIKKAEAILPEPIQATNPPPAKKSFANKPHKKPISAKTPKPKADLKNKPAPDPKQNKTGGVIPGFVKQLLLWGGR